MTVVKVARKRIDTVLVLAGGPPPLARWKSLLPVGALVVAADRGIRHAGALGLTIDVAVGDFDSIAAGELAAFEQSGGRVERHPAEKDATDLELAFQVALRHRPRRILLVGGAGGRLDHLYGELALLASDSFAEVEVDALLGRAVIHAIRGERSLVGRVGETVSLHAVNGPAIGVRTSGLRYPLRGETLEAGSSRGLSNMFSSGEAQISMERGVLMAIRPGSS